MSLRHCPECGSEVGRKEDTCPHCGGRIPKKRRIRSAVYVVVGIVVLAVIGALVDSTPEQGEGRKTEGVAVRKVRMDLPPGERKFIEVVNDFADQYRKTKGELKKSALRTERAREIVRVLGNRFQVVDWRGRIDELGTTGRGRAYVSIRLPGSKVHVKTWNNELSDLGDHTLINQGTTLYGRLSDLKKRDRVRFSGSFVPFERDGIREASLTEAGAMREPDFVMRFSDIRKD